MIETALELGGLNMDANREILKMMERLEKSNRQKVKYVKLQCLFSFVAAISCLTILIGLLVFVPRIQRLVDQAEGLAKQADTVLTNWETVTEKLAGVDYESMVSDVNSLVESSQTGVEQALDKINSIDIDTLNKAIKNLSDIIEPISDFFNKF